MNYQDQLAFEFKSGEMRAQATGRTAIYCCVFIALAVMAPAIALAAL